MGASRALVPFIIGCACWLAGASCHLVLTWCATSGHEEDEEDAAPGNIAP